MPRLRRFLVLLLTCLGLVALPMRGSEPCCDDEGPVASAHEEHGDQQVSCLSGLDEDDCADACLACCACCPQAQVATATVGPILRLPAGGDSLGDTPARGPPHRDPDELFQVPRAA